MNFRYGLAVVAILPIFYSPACLAGPCSKQIDEMQARIDAKLEAAAVAGQAGKESTASTMNRQPTPKSIAEAEIKLGDISARKAKMVGDAMARARKADLAGDETDCERALADAKRAMGD